MQHDDLLRGSRYGRLQHLSNHSQRKANVIRLLIDGTPWQQITDNSYLSGSQMGLLASTQVEVQNFKVIML